MENILSYEIEIGGNGGHFKNDVRCISIKFFNMS